MSFESGFPNWSLSDSGSVGNPFQFEDGGEFSAVADEEFRSADAALQMFAEVEDPPQAKGLDNETFMNMTIGTYMAARSRGLDEQISPPKLNTDKMMSPPLKQSLETLPLSLSAAQPNASQMTNPAAERNPESASWLLVSTDESVPHTLPHLHEDFGERESPTLEESLPQLPPVSLVSLTDFEISETVPVEAIEESSNKGDYTFSEMHRMFSAGEQSVSNMTMLLEAVLKKNKKSTTRPNKSSTDFWRDKSITLDKVGHDLQACVRPEASKDSSGVSSSCSEFKLPKSEQAQTLQDPSKRLSPPVSKSDSGLKSVSPPFAENNKESSAMAEKTQIMSPEAESIPHLLLSDSHSLGLSSRDESKMMQSLLPEACSTTFLQDSIQVPKDFLASTPLVAQQRLLPWFSGMTPLDQHSIHHVVSPLKCSPVINLPEEVDMPDVCCVMLGQQTQFCVQNEHKKGVKCTFSVKSAMLDGVPINPESSPFEIKQPVILQPESEEQVEVLFTPKYQGHFWVAMTVLAQSLVNLPECRAYTIIFQGTAEFSLLQVAPKSELLDFGDVIWGDTAHRSFKIQNIGKATVPVRFSIFRTESSLCSFSFLSDQSCDISNVSNISHTLKPEGASSVFSMSLPGSKSGEPIKTHTVKVCCQVKDVQNAEKKYCERSEKFQAVLHIDLDVPLSSRSHLSRIKLIVTAGMVKLHTDKDTCSLYCLPGAAKTDMVKVINSGNIPMNVTLHLEPSLPCFSLGTNHMLLHPQVHQLAHIEYRPQLSKNTADETTLVLFNQLCKYTIPIVGNTKLTSSKINASATSIPFGGIDVGKGGTQKFSFVADRDAMLKIYIRDGNGVFQLICEDGKMEEMMELKVKEQVKYSVKIFFRPVQVQFYSQLLVVQVLNSNRFTVPLYGYGGQSVITVTHVKTSDRGENLLDLGRISQGSPVFRNFVVTNHGVRNAHITATATDTSRKEMPPLKASVMPSRLSLEPNESKELILTFTPSETELKLCTSGRSLVAIIKLLCVDEVTRQQSLRNNATLAKMYAIDFDIPLTVQDRECPDAEAISAVPLSPQAKLFKMSMKSTKVGLLAQTFSPEKLPQRGLSPVIVDSKQAYRKKSSSTARTALQPVNLNVGVVNSNKDIWSVNPADLQFTVLSSESKEFAQIINFSNTELRFTVECDSILRVEPSHGVVSSRHWTQCEIHLSDSYWRGKEKAVSGLIKIFCAQQTQYIRVQVIPSPADLLSAASPSRKPSDKGQLDTGTSGSVGVHAANEVVVAPISLGSTSEINYVFRNTSGKLLIWSVTSCQPANRQDSADSKCQPIAESIFKLSPTSGTLEPNAVQTLKLQFSPQCNGLYSQLWMIKVVPGDGVHRFTVHGQGCRAGPSERVVEKVVSHDKPSKEAAPKLPEWMPMSSVAEKESLEKSTRMSHVKAVAGRTSKSSSVHKGSERLVGIVFLEKSHLHFGPVSPGDKQILELHVINSMDRDAEITIELEPGPPFSIRRTHFKIGKTRMIRFPITFKPVTEAKLQRKIVMREKKSLRVLTATIDGDCVL